MLRLSTRINSMLSVSVSIKQPLAIDALRVILVRVKSLSVSLPYHYPVPYTRGIFPLEMLHDGFGFMPK